MNKLDDLVKGFIERSEGDATLLKELEIKQHELVTKQEEKARQTAMKLIPAMELIASMGYRFKGKDTNYMSSRGPVLYHDSRNNMLYVFSVENKGPITVNLYDNEVKRTTYRKLLEIVDFTQVMDSLLMVLHLNDDVKESYKKSNAKLEDELNKYDDI
ncbi:hypothetical protein AB1K89_06975 [Sporosarcina sp. 179-K 8C2 HS]|uniref:hypothetical protein n=1 Tax=Sporosarcina sp. 179-K 8C2 HS TaxID=3142387 RepID=UPI0039A38F73